MIKLKDILKENKEQLNEESLPKFQALKDVSYYDRDWGQTFKDLGISSSTVSRALQGQSQAVKELNDAYDKGIEAGALTARNTRNLGGAFSVLRSRLLLASFAVDMVRRTVGSLMKEYDALNQFELISDDDANGTTTHKDAIAAIKTKWPKDNSGPK